jgi:hypothetical protein
MISLRLRKHPRGPEQATAVERRQEANHETTRSPERRQRAGTLLLPTEGCSPTPTLHLLTSREFKEVGWAESFALSAPFDSRADLRLEREAFQSGESSRRILVERSHGNLAVLGPVRETNVLSWAALDGGEGGPVGRIHEPGDPCIISFSGVVRDIV